MRRLVAAVMAGVVGIGGPMGAAQTAAPVAGSQEMQQGGEGTLSAEFECEYCADERGGTG